MSVNSPAMPVVTARRDSRVTVTPVTRVMPGNAPPLPSASPARSAVLGVAPSGRRGPGVHREPGVTLWRTSMRELVYFLTLGYVQPWRRVRASARTAT